MDKKALRLLGVLILAVLTSSCAGVSQKPLQPYQPVAAYPQIPAPAFRHDLFHTVAPAETLWRISKTYDVSMEEIMRANNLSNAAQLKMGQKLLIPKAAPAVPVIALYPSSKWKYIIIHHSATDEGSALAFHKSHRTKGWNSLGYHFIIDNGTSGKDDGYLEVSPRWIKQQNGAHCNSSGMNYKAIGICLVGNFSKEKVSAKQMEALVHLVDTLRDYYDIPLSRILKHRDVPGAKTECPGNYFPWAQFKSRLN